MNDLVLGSKHNISQNVWQEKLNQEAIAKEQEDFTLSLSRANEHYKRGRELISQKQYLDGIEEYNRALALTPDNPKIIKAKEVAIFEQVTDEIRRHADLALHLLELGDVLSAKEEFRKILSLIPNEPVQKSE